MRYILAVLAVFLMVGSVDGQSFLQPSYPTLDEMRNSPGYDDMLDLSPRVICPVCKEEGKKSIVYPVAMLCTTMHCGNGYYDENGRFHPPKPCNYCTHHYRCSNGHEWTAKQ